MQVAFGEIMNKKGFTLVEVLAVVVILSLLTTIVSINIIGIRNKSLENLLETKINNIEAAAKMYGQENQNTLTETCTVDGFTSSGCTTVTVEYLINNKYFNSTETNKTGSTDLINNVTNESMLKDKVQVYRKNNGIYAKYLGK